jgi:metal-responsive CopG/Arc/MetJ family transcriptional regulator
MVKSQVTITIERELLSSIDEYRKRIYPDLSRSAVFGILLREAISHRKEISVVR